MDCPDTQWLSNAEYYRMFSRKVDERRIPVSGSLALTDRCNLRCIHCYLGQPQQASRELTTAQWLAIIDDITRAGCLYVLLTGGEPLLRKDFATIYRHAKESGLITSVFTNGTRLSSDIIALFQDLPPHGLEISLYGATDATCTKVTGRADAYQQCRTGLDKLHAAGIPFSLKTILMKSNLPEFHAIKAIARRYQADFRFDAAIFPCLDGDTDPLTQRVDPEQAVALELEEPEMVSRWKAYLDRQGEFIPSETLYNCGTGLTSFHIDARGHLQPCVLVDRVQYDLLQGEFEKGWREVIPRIRDIPVHKTGECAQCSERSLCGLCPAFFKLETGSEEVKSDYLCTMGQQRFNTIFGYNPTGGQDARRS